MEVKGNTLMQKYEIGRLLGQGTFAKVYHGRNLETGHNVAIKVIDKEKVLKVGLIEQTKREISVMGLVKHPNVVELYEVMATKTKIYLVLEYAKGGELFHKVVKGKIKEAYARRYFQQLILAMSCSHNRGVYHRDLKPENLLLDEFGNLKVTDFGLSALADSRREDGLLHTTCGTPAYVAPEVISRNGYDGAKADVWSCGVILFVLLAGHLPFNDPNLMELYKKITKARFKFPDWFSKDARKLLSKILNPNPHARISISEIMEHPWFKKGLVSNLAKIQVPDMEKVEIGVEFEEKKMERPFNLNAFDIISLSNGFDLSGFFVRNDEKYDVQFTSVKSAIDIVSRFEKLAVDLKLKVSKKEERKIKLEGINGGFGIEIELFEITCLFHMVEMRKLSGDKIEYLKMMKEDIKPGLKEIIWAWQGEKEIQDTN